MPLFSKTVDFDTPFKKNDSVKATLDLPGVPEGTQGKIKVINGFTWERYLSLIHISEPTRPY